MTPPTDMPTGDRRLGDFVIAREIGRGGMGVVYEARQLTLNRRVALKVLRGGLAPSPRAVERFRREAEAAAKLHHTNIVPVYLIGEEAGVHFYAMEFIDGPSLDEIIRQTRDQPAAGGSATTMTAAPVGDFDPGQTQAYQADAPATVSGGKSTASSALGSGYYDRAARLIADVADAIEYAHRNGVVHRDIKPANLLLSPDGRLSVNDFGLARMLEQQGLTVTGEFVGTPAYMAPEQIAARGAVDHRCDIYSLGATLYELLTLRRPFTGDHRDQVLANVLHQDPMPPRRVNRHVPVDLETICLKALEKEPARRYQTAGGMAEDLRRYVNRFAIVARRAGPLARLRKWVQRRPGLSAALAGVVLAVATAGGFAYLAHRADLRRQAERVQHEEQLQAERRQTALDKALLAAMSGDFDAAEDAIGEAERHAASAGQLRMLRGQVALHRGDATQALQHLKQAVVLLPESVAARAMLAKAHLDSGKLDDVLGGGALTEIERLTPESPEDFLFKAQLEGYVDPARGLATLDESLQRRKSSIARLVRTELQWNLASRSGKLEDVERAVADARDGKALLPGHPLALANCVTAHLLATGAYQEVGQGDKAREAQKQADQDADELLRGPVVMSTLFAVGLYLDAKGDDAAADHFRRLRAAVGFSPLDEHYIPFLYRRGRFAEALAVSDEMPAVMRDGVSATRRCYVLTELPEGPARALAACREAADAPANDMSALYPQTVLRLLGKSGEAVQASRQLKGRAMLLPPGSEEWYRALHDFCCGERTAEQLLTLATTRWNQCEGHFFLGLARLGEGDRAGAQEHFRRAVAARSLSFVEHRWSRAFLDRMTQDSAWPPWVPVRK